MRLISGYTRLERGTMWGYIHQKEIGKIDLYYQYEQMCLENPMLGEFVNNHSPENLLSHDDVKRFAAEIYLLIKRQAEIDVLKE